MNCVRSARAHAVAGVLVTALTLSLESGYVRADVPPPVLAAREAAEAANAAVLAPDAYTQAVVSFERARKDEAAGADAGRVAERYAESERLFQSATAGTRRAASTFAEVLPARDAAKSAEAWRIAPELWRSAETEFAAAARRLEQDKLEDARERGRNAAGLYRQAEMQALQGQYLADARSALKAAEDARAEKYAPRTLAKARAFLAQADTLLAANRDEPAKAEAASAAAAREARNAEQVARLVRSIDTGDRSPEDVIIGYEDVLIRVAELADVEPRAIAGDATAGAALVAGVTSLRQRADGASSELTERNRQVAGLEEEIRDLDQRLGGAAAERDQLVMTMEAEKRAREQYAQLQGLFTAAEGQVVREGDSVILRLPGLSFQPGSAKLKSGSARIMTKVEQALAVFPQSAIVVEGHTDDSGSTAANKRLAEDRATAVAQLLTGQLKIAPARVQAIGYGESRPISNNDTTDGRARNRRIDIVITPLAARP